MIRYKSFTDNGMVAPTNKVAGDQFYVNNTTGSDSNPGTKKQPFKTGDYAVGRCTANHGDTIYLMPGHSEALTASNTLALDVSGISIIGMGTGSSMPLFTLGGVSTDDINIDADNLYIQNVRFRTSVNAHNVMLDVNYGDITAEDCIFESTATGTGCVNFINLATTYDNFTFRHCKFYNPTDPAGTDGGANTGAFYFVDSENILVDDCEFYGYFETALLHNKTTAAKNVWTRNCHGSQMLSGAEVFTQVANMSGGDSGSTFIVEGATDATEALTWGILSTKFFISLTSGVGNDGAGGQLAIAATSAAT